MYLRTCTKQSGEYGPCAIKRVSRVEPSDDIKIQYSDTNGDVIYRVHVCKYVLEKKMVFKVNITVNRARRVYVVCNTILFL